MGLFISHSEAETQKIATDFAANLHGGDVVLLAGDLGSGKTAFTKGIARALGITKEIISPTFAIMNVYETQNAKVKSQNLNSNVKAIERLVHIDTYRLKSTEELLAIGAEEYIGTENTLTIIEWPEILADFLAGKKVVRVLFEHLEGQTRKMTITRD